MTQRRQTHSHQEHTSNQLHDRYIDQPSTWLLGLYLHCHVDLLLVWYEVVALCQKDFPKGSFSQFPLQYNVVSLDVLHNFNTEQVKSVTRSCVCVFIDDVGLKSQRVPRFCRSNYCTSIVFCSRCTGELKRETTYLKDWNVCLILSCVKFAPEEANGTVCPQESQCSRMLTVNMAPSSDPCMDLSEKAYVTQRLLSKTVIYMCQISACCRSYGSTVGSQ